MDVKTFVDQTLRGLAAIQQVVDTAVTTEGPIVDGYAFVSDSLYLHFYLNAKTGTIAFALIQAQQHIWGIDYDSRRNWHLHPFGFAHHHQPLPAQSIGEIIHLFGAVLNELADIS